MTHEQLWRALDTLAAEKGLSPSGLARAAGLDPTSFNKSRRIGPNGPRWPGTDSLARVLSATGLTLDAFATLVAGARVMPSGRAVRTLPVLSFSRLDGIAPDAESIDAMRERMGIGVAPDDGAYLVRLDVDRFAPALRRADLLLVSPNAMIRPGDRSIAFTGDHALACLAEEPFPRRLDTGEALATQAVLHRISWIGCGQAA